MKYNNEIKCPLCGSENLHFCQSYEVKRILHEWEFFKINIKEYISNYSLIHLLNCNDCNIQFFVPTINFATNLLYEQLEKFDWYYMSEKWEHKIALKDLIKSENILEIGSGFGDFIKKVINKKGNVIEGIELNETAVIESQRRGLPVKSVDLQEIAQEFPGHYDAVCSFQVLEHVPNPREFLDNMCNLLKPGGKLILGIPNAESFLKHQFNILDMPPHHMTRWSQSTLEKLPELFPIQLDHIKFEPLADYHVNGYVGA